jgi:hypothetical protein
MNIVCVYVLEDFILSNDVLLTKIKIMEKYELIIRGCVQYASFRILEEMLLCTVGVEFILYV